jgi:hypothetical protein
MWYFRMLVGGNAARGNGKLMHEQNRFQKNI